MIKKKFTLPFILINFLALVSSDAVKASLRPSAVLISSSRASQAMAVTSQPQLYCGRTNGNLVGCWNKEKYDQWARSQGEVQNSQSFRSSPDYKHITIDQSQVDYSPTVLLQADDNTSTNPAPKPVVNLKFDMTLQDPETNLPIQVSSSMRYGRTFVKPLLESIIAAAPTAIFDYIDRKNIMDQSRVKFQQQLEFAQRQSENQLNNLRQESQEINQKSQELAGSGLVDAGLGLLSANALLSPEQIKALQSATKIQESDLRFSRYQMNTEAYEILNQQLALKLNEKKWNDIPALVETLTYAEVNGLKPISKTLQNLVNQEGIVQANSYFDNKNFHTPFNSENGQIVRRITNRYQAFWAQSESLRYLNSQERSQYFLGSMMLSLGDEALAAGDEVRGSGFLAGAQSLIDGLTGYGTGLAGSISDIAKSIPELAHLAGNGITALLTDPQGSWDATLNFVMNLPEISSAILNIFNQDFEKLSKGSAFERGEILGKYTIDIIGLVTSAGGALGIKSVVKTGSLSEAIRNTKNLQKVLDAIPKKASQIVQPTAKQTFESITSKSKPFRDGLSFYLKKNPEIAYTLGKEYKLSASSGQKITSQFIERIAASKTKIENTAQITEVINFHKNIITKLSTLEKTNKVGIFSRAIPKEITVNGVTKKLSKEQVFSTHPSQITTEHRYTIGGDLGHSGLYMSEGSVADTMELLLLETEKTSVDQLIFDQKKFKFDSMLDLTNSNNLDALGVKTSEISSANYLYPQAIGDAAKANGFKGIIFGSTKTAGKINLVIFN
jgi:hypothetical protein